MAGNVSSSSLLKSAASAAKKQRAYEDSVAAFDWGNSQKTSDDFAAYENYLESRLDSISDPSEVLSYHTTMRAARRSYYSEELQRESIKIQTGAGSTAEKQARAIALFNQAVAFNDLNSAQNIMATITSLDIQLQNEMNAASTAIKNQQANNVKDALALAEKIFKTNGFFKSWNGKEYVELATLPKIKEMFSSPDSANDLFGVLGKEAADKARKKDEDVPEDAIVGLFDAAILAVNGVVNNLAAEAFQTTDEAQRNKLLNQINKYQTETKFELPGVKLTLNEMINHRNARNQGYDSFSVEQTTTGEYALTKKEFASDVVYIQKVDDEGKSFFEPTQVFQSDSAGKKLNDLVRGRLEELGYNVLGDINKGEIGILTPEGNRIKAVLTPTGNLRFTEFGDIKTLDIDTGQIRGDNPLIQQRFGDNNNLDQLEFLTPNVVSEDGVFSLRGYTTNQADFGSSIGGQLSALLKGVTQGEDATVAGLLRKSQRDLALAEAEARKRLSAEGFSLSTRRENGAPIVTIVPNLNTLDKETPSAKPIDRSKPSVKGNTLTSPTVKTTQPTGSFSAGNVKIKGDGATTTVRKEKDTTVFSTVPNF